jgi:hypothetical protein
MNDDLPAKLRIVAESHDDAARRQEQEADHWASLGDNERMELARRGAALKRSSARLERDQADLIDERENGT